MSAELVISASEAAEMTCLRPTSIIDPATHRVYEGPMPMCGAPASHVFVPWGVFEGKIAVKDMTAWCADHVAADRGLVDWTPISTFVKH